MEGGSGAGEVRKVHVIYFLSRNGEMEQPHLIRVRHRSHRDGIRLRDVKRWLSELRGKGMPDTFAWSYKRRYKTGYVWQDLADDDLITPISDNEYVLKGSLTTTTTTIAPAAVASGRSSSSSSSSPSAAADCVISPLSENSARTDPTAEDPFPRGNPPGDPKDPRPSETSPAEYLDRHDEVSPKPPPPPPVDHEEEEEETVDEERREHLATPPQRSDASPQITRGRNAAVLGIDVPGRLPVSSGSSLEIEEEAQPEDDGDGEEKKGSPTNDSSYSLLTGRRRPHSWCGGAGGRASHAFRNLLRCGVGAAAVDESAFLPVERRRLGQMGRGKDDALLSGRSHRDPAGGGARWKNTPRHHYLPKKLEYKCDLCAQVSSFFDLMATNNRQSRRGGKNSLGSSAEEADGEQKTAVVPGEAYKPAAEPSCSQCGKPFKPERLHAHMKCCRALRSQRKKMSSEKLMPKEAAESHRAMLSEEASSLFLLSH